MMLILGIYTFIALIADKLRNKIGDIVNALLIPILFSPLLINAQDISVNFKLITSAILLMSVAQRISYSQALLMFAAIGATNLGLEWNYAMLLLFTCSFFDSFGSLSGRKKILLALGMAAIFFNVEMLAIIFILFSALFLDDEAITITLLRSMVILSTFVFFDLAQEVQIIAMLCYLIVIFLYTHKKNLVCVSTCYFLTVFATSKFELATANLYTMIILYFIVTICSYLMNMKYSILNWLKFRVGLSELILVYFLLSMSHSWNSIPIIVSGLVLVSVYALNRFTKIEIQSLEVKKTIVFNIVLFILLVQPWTGGYQFFGFSKMVGFQDLQGFNIFATVFLVIILVVISVLVNNQKIYGIISEIIFKQSLRSEARQKFLNRSMAHLFTGHKSGVATARDEKIQLRASALNVEPKGLFGIFVFVYAIVLTVNLVIKL